MICKLSISLRINRDGYFAINFEPFVSGARHKRLTHYVLSRSKNLDSQMKLVFRAVR